RRHTRSKRDWSSDVCSSDLLWYTVFLPAYRTAFSCWKGHTLKQHQKWLLHSDRRVQDATLANKKIPPSGGISKQLVGFTNRQNGATKLLVQYFTHRQIDCTGTTDQTNPAGKVDDCGVTGNVTDRQQGKQ